MNYNNYFTIFFLCFLGTSVIVKLFLDIQNFYYRKKREGLVPELLNSYVDQNKLFKINSYTNEKLKFSLFEYFFENSLLILLLLTGIFPLYYRFLAGIFENIIIFAIIFYFSYYFFNQLISIPFQLYFNFKIEKKYDFNKMTFKIWLLDLLKSNLLSLILGIIIIIPLLLFLYHFPHIWWILLWIFFVSFTLFIQIIYPTFIAPLFNKFIPLKNSDLNDKIIGLLHKAGFKSNGVFEMDASKRSSHSNAYFSGLGKSKRIVLFDSLLEKHSDEEILAILAHELGHFKYKHILKGMIASMFISFIFLFVIQLFINNSLLYNAFGFSNTFDIEKGKFIGLFFITIIASPVLFFLTPFQSFFSRKNEYQADAYSILLMKNKDYLLNALKKLSVDNLSNIYPSKLYAWFYYSHPPVLTRLQFIKNYQLKD